MCVYVGCHCARVCVCVHAFVCRLRERKKESGWGCWRGATSYMGVSLADAGQIIGFSQREEKCV